MQIGDAYYLSHTTRIQDKKEKKTQRCQAQSVNPKSKNLEIDFDFVGLYIH